MLKITVRSAVEVSFVMMMGVLCRYVKLLSCLLQRSVGGERCHEVRI